MKEFRGIDNDTGEVIYGDWQIINGLMDLLTDEGLKTLLPGSLEKKRKRRWTAYTVQEVYEEIAAKEAEWAAYEEE